MQQVPREFQVLMEPKNALGKQYKKLFQMNDLQIVIGIRLWSYVREETSHGRQPKGNTWSYGVLDKDPYLRQWILSSVKSNSKSASPNILSAITSAFEKIFDSFTEQVMSHDKQVDINADDSSSSTFIQRQFSDPADQLSGLHLEHHGSIASETYIRYRTSPNDSEGPKSSAVDSLDHKVMSRASSSMATTVHFSSSTPNKENHISRHENGMNSNFESPEHRFLSWYCDGHRAAMDIYSASRHLWVGSLCLEASDTAGLLKMRPKMTPLIFIKLIILALLGAVIDHNLFIMGLKYTTATFATAMYNTIPAITFVMACFLRCGEGNTHSSTSGRSLLVRSTPTRTRFHQLCSLSEHFSSGVFLEGLGGDDFEKRL